MTDIYSKWTNRTINTKKIPVIYSGMFVLKIF